MLRRFFKGRDRLTDADPQVRREAVLALDATNAQARSSALATLLAGDPDRNVRLAAIERLETIGPLASALDDDAVGEAAAKRILALARSSGASLPEHPRLRALGLLQAAPEQQQAQIAGMTDPAQLIALALKDRGALREAVLAHPAMQTGGALALMEKRSRGTDKSLNRHARQSLDQLKRLHLQAAASRQRAEELAASLTRSAAASDRAAADRATLLYQQYVAMLATYDEAADALRQFGESLTGLEELRASVAVPAPRPEPARPPTADEAAALADPAAELPLDLAAEAPIESSTAVALGMATDATATTGDEAPARELGATAAPEPADDTSVANAPVGEPSADDTHAAAEREAAAAKRQAADAERQLALTALGTLLDALEEEIAGGHLITARQRLTEARSRLDALGVHAPRRLGSRLTQLGARLAELRDWQHYATLPKREALCDALQTLVDRPLAPPDQAERLKALRADWRELGPIVQAADARLADRFNALAELAFEPCRAYFAEQAEIRRANLAERERICSQLAQYLAETDWHHADMKAAEQILRAAREAWRLYVPVDRSAGKAVEVRFEGLQEDLHNRLKAFWDGNAEAKRQIVAEAEALAGGNDDIDGRINRAKGLQQRWKTVGPVTPRTLDQALWSAFRVACDALFAARDTARNAADFEIRELAGQCAAALDAFATELAELTPAGANEAQARALRERLRALDELPPGLRQPLAARRSDLLARHQTLMRERGHYARQTRLAELRSRDEAFSTAEMASRAGGATPVAPEPCFAARAGGATTPVPREELRRLTIRAEQSAGIAPPAEDEPLRLAVQVERLRAGLGGADEESPIQMAERWCAIGPKDAAVDPLRARFFAALARRLN